MPDAASALVALPVAAALSALATPIARRIAIRTDFLDHPVRYKKHAAATPYLGGAAVLAAFTIAAGIFGDALSDFTLIIALALALAAMGTIDDRRTLKPGLRFGLQLLAGFALWLDGIRWEPTGLVGIDLPITLIWVAGLANAFNLLDNIDGAAATTAAASAAGIGAIALTEDAYPLAATALALSGACIGFLFFNLARPAKIFLGDGGSLPIGFLIAALAMLIPTDLGGSAILAAVPLAGVAIFDTSLVVVSRTRRGVSILTGGRDHTTHRLLTRLGSPAAVAGLLAAAQACLCALSWGMQQGDSSSILVLTAGYVLAGVTLLVVFERPEAPGPAWRGQVE